MQDVWGRKVHFLGPVKRKMKTWPDKQSQYQRQGKNCGPGAQAGAASLYMEKVTLPPSIVSRTCPVRVRPAKAVLRPLE